MEKSLGPSHKTKHASRLAPKKQEERREHVVQFYSDVLKTIRTANKICLMGPGIAKKEFKLFLKRQDFSGRVVEIEMLIK